AFIAEPATSKIGRLLMGGLRSWRSLAGDRGQHRAHLGFDERHRGAVLEGGLRKGGVLAVAVDGVAVQAGLRGRACEARGLAGGGGGRMQRRGQGAVEIQVRGLVARGVGVGDVGAEQLQALLAQGERGAVDAKEIGHGPSGGGYALEDRQAVCQRRRATAAGAQPRALTRAVTRCASSRSEYLGTKSSAPTRSTMAWLNTPDSEVCSSTNSPRR